MRMLHINLNYTIVRTLERIIVAAENTIDRIEGPLDEYVTELNHSFTTGTE